MTVSYDAEEDVLHILFRSAPIETSEELRQDLVLDFDDHGGIVGLELRAASRHISRTDAATWSEREQISLDPLLR